MPPPSPQTEDVFDKLAKLPETVRQFITDPSDEDAARVFSEAGLTPEQVRAVSGVIREVYFKERPVAGFHEAVKGKLTGEPDEKLAKLARDFIGFRFLPIDDHLGGGAQAALRALGGTPEQYPQKRITIRSVHAEDLVGEVLRDHPVNVPAYLEPRLREILESRVRGVRKDEETVQRLTRAEKIGGASVDPVDARALVGLIAARLPNVRIATGRPEPSVVAPPAASPNAAPSRDVKVIPTTAVTAASVAVPTGIQKKTETVSPEDEREAAIIKERVLPRVVSRKEFDFENEVNAGAVRVIDASGVTVPAELSERLRTIVVSRLKDVRKPADTKQLLTRETKSGGMGLDAATAEGLLRALEAEFTRIHSAQSEAIRAEKERYVQNAAAEASARDEGRRTAEEADLNRLYSSVTRRPAEGVPVAARSTAPAASPQPDFLADLRASSSVKTAGTPPSPKMQDVRQSARRLTGPLEELTNLSLTDFRRLSTDPAEACRKLGDKLDLLEEQSYARRIEGVKGWQSSPVNTLYLTVIRESFGSAKPIAAIIREREGVNEPTLTEREVRAIMEFNRKLKF